MSESTSTAAAAVESPWGGGAQPFAIGSQEPE